MFIYYCQQCKLVQNAHPEREKQAFFLRMWVIKREDETGGEE
jgi:hypothetical protein